MKYRPIHVASSQLCLCLLPRESAAGSSCAYDATVMGSLASEAAVEGKQGGNTRGYYERIPRGRCHPPIPPTPDPRRGEAMRHKKDAEAQSNHTYRRPSQIVVMSKGAGAAPRQPMPEWKRGYVGFKRKVKSSAFIPLLMLVAVCGAGVHVVGLVGVSFGFFTWSVGCEGVVTVTGDNERANGIQTYSLGWMRYAGRGPETASDSPTVPVNITSNNSTAGSDLGKGGVAGSSIPENGWLAGVDVITAVFGVLTAAGHLAGFAFYMGTLFMVQLLFRSQFRSDRCVFRAAVKGSVSLLVWVVGVGVVGFYLSAQEGFTESVLETLHNEGFLCQDNRDVGGEFSFIATGFGCVAGALTCLLAWWFGNAADLALADGFNRRRASLPVVSP